MNRQKWEDVYQGAEEQKFFMCLARHPSYCWRSVEALAKASKPSNKTLEEQFKSVEKMISKFYQMGIVVQNPKNHDQWGYWKRVKEEYPDMSIFKTTKSLSADDKKKRIDKFMKN